MNSIEKKNGIVNFQCDLGMIQDLLIGNYPLIIPDGFRPSESRLIDVKCESDETKSTYCIINPDGKVVIYGNLLNKYSYFIEGTYIQN